MDEVNTQSRRHTYCYVEPRPAAVQFGDTGLMKTQAITKGYIKKIPPPPHGPRGPLTGKFSRVSALNLRKKLACLPVQTFGLYGVTLTLPAQVFRGAEDFKKCWADFCSDISDNLRRYLKTRKYSSRLGFLWRIELTRGENEAEVRTPHFHCILWTNTPSDVQEFACHWCDQIEKWYKLDYSLDPQIAAKSSEIRTHKEAFQYVANHSTKHKKEQLGWPGRQWGVFYGTRENGRLMKPILCRFDKKNVREIATEPTLSEAQTQIMARPNKTTL